MDAAFWQGVWERNTIGFHQDSEHPFLLAHFDKVVKPNDKHVFVPLCGKSFDMVWLAQRLAVTGSELSDIACRDFFNELELPAQSTLENQFKRYQHNNLELWQGDFFQLSASDIVPVDIIYDRAALIALPEEMQAMYVQHLLSFMQPNTRLFLVSLEFPSSEMSGPPFPIVESQVRALFQHNQDNPCQITEIAHRELTDKRFAQRVFNVSSLVERLYLITL